MKIELKLTCLVLICVLGELDSREREVGVLTNWDGIAGEEVTKIKNHFDEQRPVPPLMMMMTMK